MGRQLRAVGVAVKPPDESFRWLETIAHTFFQDLAREVCLLSDARIVQDCSFKVLQTPLLAPQPAGLQPTYVLTAQPVLEAYYDFFLSEKKRPQFVTS